MPVSPDTLIANRYRLLERLGVGGMGEVWKARDTNFTRPVIVAVKLLKEDEIYAQDAGDGDVDANARRLRELFSNEANAVAILQHPNIVRVTNYGEHDRLPFLVMDYISGRTLQQVIQRREPMALTRRLRLMEDLCEGLAYAHGKELIHRDIKPANLIIEAETQRLKIVDFGIVRSMDALVQHTLSSGMPIGTLCYMSPEQTRASRTIDNRSDIFSVGLVCYELLGYARAFSSRGDFLDLVYRIQNEPPPPLRDLVPDLDPAIEAIVAKAIEKAPSQRYRDLADMQRDCEAVRTRLEDEEKRALQTRGDRTRVSRPKPLAQRLADLVERAAGAFEMEDDEATIEFCEQVLVLAPNQPDAIELRERARHRIARRATDAAANTADVAVLQQMRVARHEAPRVEELQPPLQTPRRNLTPWLAAAAAVLLLAVAVPAIMNRLSQPSEPPPAAAGSQQQQQQQQPSLPVPTPGLRVLSREGVRTLPIITEDGIDFVALDDMATTFGLTFKEDRDAGGVVVTAGKGSITIAEQQALASVNGRIVALPANPIKRDTRWLVPLDLVSRAVAPALNVRLELRRASRLAIVGDVRVPQVVIRVQVDAGTTPVLVEMFDSTGQQLFPQVTREPAQLVVTFEGADALDLSLPDSIPPQDYLRAIAPGSASTLGLPTSVSLEVGPRFREHRGAPINIDNGWRYLLELLGPAT